MGTAKGNGKAYQWLVDHVGYQGDECLRWPFSIDGVNGRGSLGHNGKHQWAHRLMCKLAHGEPPTPKHQAAHSCGKGHEACVNPRHLEWKTRRENHLDCRQHGTQSRTRNGNRGVLTPADVEQIHALRGAKLQKDIAKMFGVSPSTISHVWAGRTFAKPRKLLNFTPDEDAKLRLLLDQKLSAPAIADALGRPRGGIYSRMERLGLKSKWERPTHSR